MVTKLKLLILLTTLFISCGAQYSPSLQDIVNQWIEIEEETIVSSIDAFLLTLNEFQQSELHRTYRAIPFSQAPEFNIRRRPLTDIEEVRNVSDLALIYRDSIASGDIERAQAVSVEITSELISLLMIDGDAQRYVNTSYYQLLITLIVFFAFTTLLTVLLNKSLTGSLKRETQGTIFSHAYMLAQDEERGRISRELHDTIIQDMRYLLLETEKMAHTEGKNEREKLGDKTVPMMADLIRKARDICNDLIPPDFRFNELPDSLRQLCLDFSERTGIDCRAEIEAELRLDFLTMEKKLQVFRIVQEALSNIEKHAGAKEVIVTMCLGQNGFVFIGISDDGKGFKSPLDNNGQIISGFKKSHIEKSHIGIISMKERAAILGGVLKIITEPGEGSLVCLEIPPAPAVLS